MRLGSPVKLIGIQSRTEVNGQRLAGQLMGCDCARADGATPADYDPAPDGVASACHPAEPVSCGRYDGAVTKFGGWKGKRFAVV